MCVQAACSMVVSQTTPLCCRCIWHDAEGWRAFSDVCPHRLIPLTEGRISADGNLQCGYHGWEFEGSGSCVAIPQGGNPRNPRACAVAYQAAERQGEHCAHSGLRMHVTQHKQFSSSPGAQHVTLLAAGLLWVRLQKDTGSQPDTSDIPILPEWDEGWIESGTFRDLPYDYSTLLENLLDVSLPPGGAHGGRPHVSLTNGAGDQPPQP